jgi:hypothetical protein
VCVQQNGACIQRYEGHTQAVTSLMYLPATTPAANSAILSNRYHHLNFDDDDSNGNGNDNDNDNDNDDNGTGVKPSSDDEFDECSNIVALLVSTADDGCIRIWEVEDTVKTKQTYRATVVVIEPQLEQVAPATTTTAAASTSTTTTPESPFSYSDATSSPNSSLSSFDDLANIVWTSIRVQEAKPNAALDFIPPIDDMRFTCISPDSFGPAPLPPIPLPQSPSPLPSLPSPLASLPPPVGLSAMHELPKREWQIVSPTPAPPSPSTLLLSPPPPTTTTSNDGGVDASSTFTFTSTSSTPTSVAEEKTCLIGNSRSPTPVNGTSIAHTTPPPASPPPSPPIAREKLLQQLQLHDPTTTEPPTESHHHHHHHHDDHLNSATRPLRE